MWLLSDLDFYLSLWSLFVVGFPSWIAWNGIVDFLWWLDGKEREGNETWNSL